MSVLPDIVSRLQVFHEGSDSCATFNLIVVATRPADSTGRPVSPVGSDGIGNNAGHVQISACMQSFHVVVDDLQQFVSVDEFARHFHLPSALRKQS
ncbi:hypothetical protein [Burkholderia sp. BCC1640]|uniref:hypothetical protein n=1 Tax=Burkholderia sp. BCC1640 TaxID=2676294 RepID=UPI00158B651F|nr:hypothetical protein [Burkholderia sp. BCC1640]